MCSFAHPSTSRDPFGRTFSVRLMAKNTALCGRCRQRGVPLKYFSHRTKREEGMVITQRLSNGGREGGRDGRVAPDRVEGNRTNHPTDERESGRAGEVTFSSFLFLFFIQRYEEKERETE